MSMLTIAGIIAAAYIVLPRLGFLRPTVAPASIPQPHEQLDRETAACMCCDLADYFESLGDPEAVAKVGELAQRIISGDRVTAPITPPITGGTADASA